MSADDPLLWTAAKAVAEQRQHGCHYAEGACVECVAIAEKVLRSIVPKKPSLGALEWMARAHSPRLWDAIDKKYSGDISRIFATSALRDEDLDAMARAYRAMPVWRVLWAYDENTIWDTPERIEIRSVACVAGCGRQVEYEVREFGPQSALPPLILCDACAEKGR
jgi:hypothetical protein